MTSTPSRRAALTRRTAETDIAIVLDLDGSGEGDIATGVGFFDHMLGALARHALFDLDVKAKGDLHIDDHHTVEDVGIVLGQGLREALGEKRGITRFGQALVPMDEALIEVAVDLSGRAHFAWGVSFEVPKIGSFDTQLVEEFFRAFTMQAGAAIHINQRAGRNAHHVAEACFKGVARALRGAVAMDPRLGGRIPSTKGALDG